MTIYLIRHTAVAAAGICYGHHDVPLADTFATEAAQLRAKLPPAPAAGYRAFSSPAARCLALAAEFAAEVTPDERLREMHFGTWENRAWNDLPAAETAPWMADYVNLAPPGGETFGAVQARAAAFLADLEASAVPLRKDAATLVFTHGGTIRALVAHCLEMPLRNAFQLQVDFASVTRLQQQHGRWNLLGLNG
ncbi:histidine phosphatase family protein [Hymenobacter artigasi]|uniref:Alpha-ribazole phosphatase n=1 Tax=Hymenobacter artigasi TaxID=2719616 RepID=A0ABX1HHV0_9BACT|nr:histidine phosphatase family protein [Hymenobacter artigasi]NKI89640.1 alpha-ribazole phosphatase [Hymenobacter artigasi]